jgi:SAM-dependent methyltransferase
MNLKGERFSKEIEVEQYPCPLGCPEDDIPVLEGRDRLHDLPGVFSVVRCRTCGLMRTNPRPTQASISFYYPNNYGPYHGTKVRKHKEISRKNSLWKSFVRRVIKFHINTLPDMKPGRFLEIGCASGAFMYRMLQLGWDVYGIEYSKEAGDNARASGLNVHIGPIETAPPPDVSYDLTVGWMTLEHFHDPVLALKKLYEWTNPGGYLVLSVPNAGSLEFKIFGHAWYALQLPTHLYHFTPRTMRTLLMVTGWEIQRIYHQRVLSNFFGSLGYVLMDLGFKNRFVRWLINVPNSAWKMQYFLYPIAVLLGALGQTGRMTVLARKIHD